MRGLAHPRAQCAGVRCHWLGISAKDALKGTISEMTRHLREEQQLASGSEGLWFQEQLDYLSGLEGESPNSDARAETDALSVTAALEGKGPFIL